MTSKLTDRQFRLAQAVQAHASAHYNEGWDTIVECYTLADLAEVFGAARTEAGAIKKVGALVSLRREAAENAGWSEAQRELKIGYADMWAELAPQGAAPEADGSVVTCDYSWDGELLSATRTWPGKVGHAEIAVQWDGDEEPAEVYVPGWRGVVVRSANYCDHDAAKAAASGWGGCWTDGCRRPNCIPF